MCRDNKHQGWQQLAGLFLSITGAEALYADLGHFNKTAIRVSLALDLLKACRLQEGSAAADSGLMHLQVSFICIAYPSLIITYLGQAAWLLAFPDQVGFPKAVWPCKCHVTWVSMARQW